MDIDLTRPLMALRDPALFRQQGCIAGAWQDADSGDTIAVNNPADGRPVGTMPKMGAAETARAIDAAEAAWPDWRARTAKERSQIIRRWHDLILENGDDLALIMTLENGKPLAESKGEIAYSSWFVDWFAEEGKRAYGRTIPSTMGDRRILTIKQPVGVCGLITPWNFPAAMITRKGAPALAAGCTMVIKPASATPFTATALVELALRAGVPPGVMNIISGPSGPIGDVLCESPKVRKISFTGSTEVGRTLIQKAASTIKNVSMELGGNAPLIIFDDADLDAAVEGAMACKYRNGGQTCVCANRIFVQDGIYDAFAEKFAAQVRGLAVGNGLSEGTEIGPLIDRGAVEKVEGHVSDAVSGGAVIAAGGQRHQLGGNFYQPTVLTGVSRTMRIFHEETFGPVAPLIRFSSEAEVIEMANDTCFGLAGYFYSRDVGRIWRVAEALEYGMVAVNAGILSSEVAPFGGVKESGIGREGSKYGMDDFVEIKYLCLGGIDG
jgi:succinate-semialdehyde dehydrogenase/glutarate-semialdehyde dehydrogenase